MATHSDITNGSLPAQVPEAYRGATGPVGTVAVALGTLIAVIALVYGIGVWWFGAHFVPGTTVGGHDVSWMDASEVAHQVEERVASYHHEVTGDGVSLTVPGDAVGLQVDSQAYAAEALAGSDPLAWPFDLLFPKAYPAPSTVSLDHEQLAALVDESVGPVNEQAVAPVGATGAWNDESGAFVVVPPVPGTTIDVGAATAAIEANVVALAPATELGERELVQPAVAADNEQLHTAVDKANAMAALEIPLVREGVEYARVGREQVSAWVHISPELTAVVDPAATVGWAAGDLASLISVDDEVRAWAVDAEATGAAIAGALDALSDEPIEISMEVVETRPAESEGAHERGRHLDVNLTNQYARLYDADGRVLWRSYIVSGDTSREGRATPTGSYEIRAKQTNVTLEGQDEDKDGEPDYKSFVRYWMPFLGNTYGLHDADWRSRFGGDIYSWNGSHGCVNLPVDAAGELFGLIEVGDPVIVHW